LPATGASADLAGHGSERCRSVAGARPNDGTALMVEGYLFTRKGEWEKVWVRIHTP